MKQSCTVLFLFHMLLASCLAVSTEIVSLNRSTDFIDGKLTSVQVDPDGIISLSNKVKTLWETEDEITVFALAMDYGKNIIAGTGNQGKIYKISDKGEPLLLLDSPEIAILSLYCSSNGNIYAGTAPDGIIYRISPKGDVDIFARTEAHYVWGIVQDSVGNIWAITGDKGKVIRYSGNGEPQKIFELDAEHARSIASATSCIWIGTADPAVVYRIEKDDIQAVYDARESEINAIAVASDNTVYFSAIASSTISGMEIRPGMALKPNIPSQVNSEVSTIYKISPHGHIEEWWSTSAVPIFDLTIIDANPTVACGGNGYLFKILSANQAALLASQYNHPVTTLLFSDNRLIGGTSSKCGVFTLSQTMSESGVYEAEVYDAGIPVEFGVFMLTGRNISDSSCSIETRSGNRKEPDEYWSDWQPLQKDGDVQRIQSPAAQFFQWRLTMTETKTGDAPFLESVEFSISKPNRAPRITELIVYPVSKGVLMDQPGSTGKMFRQEFPDGTRLEYIFRPKGGDYGIPKGRWFKLRGMRTVTWTVIDPDDDQLSFDISISPCGQNKWTSLEIDYSDPIYSFDSTAFPDGLYQIRIQASDKIDNYEGSIRNDTRVSKSFTIDNTPPEFFDLKSYRHDQNSSDVVFTGIISDNLTRIAKLEYSADADNWFPFNGKDRLVDSQREPFEVIVHFKEIPTVIYLRGTDEHENVGTAAVNVLPESRSK